MSSYYGPILNLLDDSAFLVAGFACAILLYFLSRYRQERKPLHRYQTVLMGGIILFEASLVILGRSGIHNPDQMFWLMIPLWVAPIVIPEVFGILVLYTGPSANQGQKAPAVRERVLVFTHAILIAIAIPSLVFGGWWNLLLLVAVAAFGWAAWHFGRFFSGKRAGIVFRAGLVGFLLCALGLALGLVAVLGDWGVSNLIWNLSMLLVQVGILGVVVGFTLLEERHLMAVSQTAILACEELQYVRAHDPLTGLHNRDTFRQVLSETLEAQSGEAPDNGDLGLFFVDLDHFRDINDSLGSDTGDQLLQAVAERLTVIAADTERVFRTGEDEFALIIPRLESRSLATQIAEEVLVSFNRHFCIQGHEVFLTASIGIALAPRGENAAAPSAAELIHQADTALRHAKLDRNTYRYHTPDLGGHGLSKLHYFNYLRQAIDRHELTLHFQPQVDQGGRVVSAEALLRWQNPVLGSVPPSEFIPVAEEAGLILPIGDWVIERACAELAHWRSIGLDIPLAVNISPRQLKDTRLEFQLMSRLRKYGLKSSCLHLEITESSLIEDTTHTMRVLQNLSRAGFVMSIDDFGTGYANLAWLKRLPVSKLKIDRSFVVDLPHNRQDLAVIQAIVSIAKSRGMGTIAEGVESPAQLKLLHDIDCQLIQGNLYSRPLPSAEFIRYAMPLVG